MKGKSMASKYFPALALLVLALLGTTSFAQEAVTSGATGTKQASPTIGGRPKYNEIYHANVSDLVVIGQVTKVANLPGPSSELFHSEAVVRIDSVLKGEVNFGKLILLMMSGPITDSGIINRWSWDANFEVGEQGIFFLHRPDEDHMLTAPFVQRGLFSLGHLPKKGEEQSYKTSFYGRKSQSDLPDSVFWGDNACFNRIVNGVVTYKWGTFTIGTVAREIRTSKPSTEY